MIYAWQKQPWQILQSALCAKRLPHALLLKGASGIGKLHFANVFAQALLCLSNQDDGMFCGQCHGCKQVEGHAHPDLLMIAPEKPGQAIKVDQVRAMVEFVSQSSLQNGYRVVIINPAHVMNVNAANALLKTLEEPARDVMIMLVTSQPNRLLPTIMSRCQSVFFATPPRQDALSWLQTAMQQQDISDNTDPAVLLNLTDGSPLAAFELLTSETLKVRAVLFKGLTASKPDPLKLSSELHKQEPLVVLDFYLSWLADILRLASAVREADISNLDYLPQLIEAGKSISQQRLLDNIHYVQQTRKLIASGINLNKQLMLEDLFVRWTHHANISS